MVQRFDGIDRHKRSSMIWVLNREGAEKAFIASCANFWMLSRLILIWQVFRDYSGLHARWTMLEIPTGILPRPNQACSVQERADTRSRDAA
jgi:hypothetical protein